MTAAINPASRAITPADANTGSTTPGAVEVSRVHKPVSSCLSAATHGTDPLYTALTACQASGQGSQGARLCIRCKLDTCGGLKVCIFDSNVFKAKR